MSVLDIKFFNRENNELETEKVYGDKAIKWLYGSSLGHFLGGIAASAPISKFYGSMQGSKFISQKKVAPFVKNFNIPIDDYLPEEGKTTNDPHHGYSTFNNFFIRRFKEGKRPFDSDENILPAFSEARYFGYETVLPEENFPVKGKFLSPEIILNHSKWGEVFSGGPLLLARLCPVDYHRYHYPDDGEVVESFRHHGPLHSVNPIALKMKGDILCTNERQITILKTKNFGMLAYVEVGATMVGKIVQSHQGPTFKRGDEKGYFLFGGSTVIVIGEKGKWTPDKDILENTKKGIEVYIKLGQSLGKK